MNSIFITGRLASTPTLTINQNNTSICKYLIAVWDPYEKNKDKDTTFFNCVSYGKQAEFIAEKTQKGEYVNVRGKMKCNKYNGAYYWGVVADTFEKTSFNTQEEERVGTQNNYIAEPINDDDIPF